MWKTPPPNFTKISESTIKNQKSQQKWWKQFVDKRHHRRKSAIAARLPEDLKDAGTSKGISFDLQSRSPLHDPPPHSPPLAHFTSQKAGGKCHMKARSGGSKKLPYLHPCHPVIFHPTFSAYWAHGPLQTVLHAIFLQSEKQAQVQLGGVSVSVIGLLAHSDVAWGVTWDYQEQCEVILRNATSPDFLHISLDASSHSRSRG